MNTILGIILIIDIDIDILEDINIDFIKHILSLETYICIKNISSFIVLRAEVEFSSNLCSVSMAILVF